MSNLKVIGFVLPLLFGSLNAHAGARSLAQPADSIDACIQAIGTAGEVFTARLVDGSRIEIARSTAGAMPTIRLVKPDGAEEVLAPAIKLSMEQGQDLDAAEADRSPKHHATDGFRTMVQRYCSQLGRNAPLRKSSQDADTPDPVTDWKLWPELLDQPSFWDMVDNNVGDAFYYGMGDWSEQIATWYEALEAKRNLPQCSAVRESCQSSCDRIGTYAGGTVCVALGGAAGLLNPSIGLAVGAYCAGKVYVKVEECRFSCVVPAIACTD